MHVNILSEVGLVGGVALKYGDRPIRRVFLLTLLKLGDLRSYLLISVFVHFPLSEAEELVVKSLILGNVVED